MTATTVVHVRDGFDLYVGRANPRRGLPASIWGNPYRIGPDGTREEVIAMFRQDLLIELSVSPATRAALLALRGKRLGCFCAPQACHGDVLAELADSLTDSEPEA